MNVIYSFKLGNQIKIKKKPKVRLFTLEENVIK